MPYRFRSLNDIAGVWEGRIVRISRIVSKPGAEVALLAAITDAVAHVAGVERAYVGFHQAPGGRAVVLLQSIWESPERLRAAHQPDRPLGFDSYADLVESWTLEYFEEYLDSSSKEPRDRPRPRSRATADTFGEPSR
ncbi:MAG: hypothetical protein M3N29_04245 [Chloroflexota bacterium]|nr:hypothetical protein [Chloroflexota bacterium]